MAGEPVVVAPPAVAAAGAGVEDGLRLAWPDAGHMASHLSKGHERDQGPNEVGWLARYDLVNWWSSSCRQADAVVGCIPVSQRIRPTICTYQGCP